MGASIEAGVALADSADFERACPKNAKAYAFTKPVTASAAV